MAADPRVIELLSYYRDAELHGATLLLRLIKLMDDPDAQVKLSLHLAEETHHAWLWTKRINDLGGEPMKVLDGYQKRIGLRTVPRSLLDLLALTVVVEERSFARYSGARRATQRRCGDARGPQGGDQGREVAHRLDPRQADGARRAGGRREKAEAAIEKYRQIDAAGVRRAAGQGDRRLRRSDSGQPESTVIADRAACRARARARRRRRRAAARVAVPHARGRHR